MFATSALILGVSTFALLVIFWLLCTIHMIKQFCWNTSSKSAITYQRMPAILYLISYSSAIVLILILAGLTLSNLEIFWIENIGFKIMVSFIIALSCIGGLSMYYLFLNRLYRTFKSSNPIHKVTFIIYIIVILIIVALLSFYASSYLVFKKEIFDPYPNVIYIVAITGITLNIITALSIVYQFIHRLQRVVINLKDETLRSKAKLDRNQEKMLRFITKQSLLCSVGLISFNVAIPITISIYVWILPHTVWAYLITVLMSLIFHSIEMVSIMLQFAVNNKYYKFCCKRSGHRLCDKCCKTYTLYQIELEMEKKSAKHDELQSQFEPYQENNIPTTQNTKFSHLPSNTNTTIVLSKPVYNNNSSSNTSINSLNTTNTASPSTDIDAEIVVIDSNHEDNDDHDIIESQPIWTCMESTAL